MDRSRWRKLIKDMQPTWVVPDKGLLNGCVCLRVCACKVVLSGHISASFRGDTSRGRHRRLLSDPRLTQTWFLYTLTVHQIRPQVNERTPCTL